MKRIVITWPEFIADEARHIIRLLDEGTDRIHLRKPESDIHDCARLLEAIPEEYYQRISLHDHFELLRDYPLGGVHLNRRNPLPPEDFKGLVSCSCHSFEEVERRKQQCDYVFLSPIFNSISKQGYAAAFTDDELRGAADSGLVDDRVYALGGVSADKLPLLTDWHFGGYVQLGAVWKPIIKG